MQVVAVSHSTIVRDFRTSDVLMTGARPSSILAGHCELQASSPWDCSHVEYHGLFDVQVLLDQVTEALISNRSRSTTEMGVAAGTSSLLGRSLETPNLLVVRTRAIQSHALLDAYVWASLLSTYLSWESVDGLKLDVLFS